METVILETRDTQFVARVEVPPFNPPAEIILWGSRYFIQTQDPNTYREGLCVPSFTPSPGLPDDPDSRDCPRIGH